MDDKQIKHMVNRFLSWKLPENFNPDAGISFKRTFNDHTPSGPQKHEPSGTNLFDATQAEAMVRHMVYGLTETETIQTLLDLLNPLHGSLDQQTYDEKCAAEFVAHPDDEYSVIVTAKMERDLTQAVLILEDRKRQAGAHQN